MNNTINTLKNIACGGLCISASLIAKRLGKRYDIDLDSIIATAGGVAGSILSSEIDKHTIKLLEFSLRNPNALNHDILRLSEIALKLSIKNIGKLYKDEVGNEFEGAIDEQIKILQKVAIRNFDAKANDEKQAANMLDNDIIKYVDGLNPTADNAMLALVTEISEDLPVICKQNPFNQYFRDNFNKYYRLYFGELLKKNEYNKALIAYQRQVQSLMFDAIRQNSSIPNDEIIWQRINELTGRQELLNAIDDINHSLQNINVRLNEIHSIIEEYIKSNTLEIEALRGDILTGAESQEFSTDLEKFKEETKDYLFFKYKGYSHSIDDLTEDDFNYFTKRIKANRILISNLLNAIKNTCSKWDSKGIYGRIEHNENWIINDTILRDGQDFIKQNFLGIITPYINSLFAIEKNEDKQLSEQKQIESYIYVCRTIIKTVIDLSVNVLLAYLLEENIHIKDGDKLKIKEHFETESKSTEQQIVFAYRFMNILSLSEKADSNLLQELLNLKDYFSESGILSVLWKEIDKLHEYDINRFDNYRAEKILTEFLTYFAFLANYNLTSIQGIEYHNIKECKPKYIQHYSSIDFSQGGKINHKATENVTFTHAVFLQNRTDEEQRLNLFPFVIDRNALKNERKTAIAFFNYQNIYADNPYLEYDILGFQSDKNNPGLMKYEEITDANSKYSESNIEKHNINCVLESFEKIKEILIG
ncbi:MAG: hypothetical protein LBL07_19055 [Tannerella sp.]|jgi:hypothetical protein|nr:hypothetical protein [Tannerella sp.]